MKKIGTVLLSLLFAHSLYAKPSAEIAILLDTSGSMQGLINQVRDGLWQTLNGLGEIKKEDEVAELRLALYEYGSGVVPAEQNYIQLLVPLTSDHTLVAEKLFATKATGSQEYSGQAIKQATEDLKFSLEGDDFRTIVIAGNETIHQGPTPPLEAAASALARGILVNSIFAGAAEYRPRNIGGRFGGGFGPPQPHPTPNPAPPHGDPKPNPIFLEWRELAFNGGGKVLNIDHNNVIPHIPSPYDDDIIKKTEAISDTYLPYGKDGQTQYNRMRNIDRQVRGSGNGSYIGWGDYRSGHFGQANYSTWDLVSAYREKKLDLNMVSNAHLPASLRGLPNEVKLKKIVEMNAKRKGLEDEISELRKKRQVHVDKIRGTLSNDQQDNFIQAIKKILVEQLQEKGFSLTQGSL